MSGHKNLDGKSVTAQPPIATSTSWSTRSTGARTTTEPVSSTGTRRSRSCANKAKISTDPLASVASSIVPSRGGASKPRSTAARGSAIATKRPAANAETVDEIGTNVNVTRTSKSKRAKLVDDSSTVNHPVQKAQDAGEEAKSRYGGSGSGGDEKEAGSAMVVDSADSSANAGVEDGSLEASTSAATSIPSESATEFNPSGENLSASMHDMPDRRTMTLLGTHVYRNPSWKICTSIGCTKMRIANRLCAEHGGNSKCAFPAGCNHWAYRGSTLCSQHGGGPRCQHLAGCVKGAAPGTLYCRVHGGGKRCDHESGCTKAQVPPGTLCIGHGGGRRCQYDQGCTKSAVSPADFCIAHGGGRKCLYDGPEGCLTAAASTSPQFCIAHGGGRRCQDSSGCAKGAEGRTELCVAHGGGRRCQYADGEKPCAKAARGGSTLCFEHGGGKRCAFDGCTKSTRPPGDLCASHGGGRRCEYPGGCTKVAQLRSKIVRCATHGGGRRCDVPECTKAAAPGKVPRCIKHGGGVRCEYADGCSKAAAPPGVLCKGHGGGRRCQFEGCAKSAQGSTMLCFGHGGGKRCQHNGCGKGAVSPTDKCLEHGGGKRCTFIVIESEGDVGIKCTTVVVRKTQFCAMHGRDKRCAYVSMSKVVRLAVEQLENGATATASSSMERSGDEGDIQPVQGIGEGHMFECGKAAAPPSGFCVDHGGGKRCEFSGGCSNIIGPRSKLCSEHNTLSKPGGKRKKRCAPSSASTSTSIDSAASAETTSSSKKQKLQQSECEWSGCKKSSLSWSVLCVKHTGGSVQCKSPDGCKTAALKDQSFCSAHGGGAKCDFEAENGEEEGEATVVGCNNAAVANKTDNAKQRCTLHGGGRANCGDDKCVRNAMKGSTFCKAHGGGRLCEYQDCTRTAARRAKMCIAHGPSGARCQHLSQDEHGQLALECIRGAVSPTDYCVRHGGGRRCVFQGGCSKAGQGPSSLCIAHGGGKRCQLPDCENRVTKGVMCRDHEAIAVK